MTLLAVACNGDDGGDDVGGPGGSKTVVVEPGTGEPNTEPLFPMRVGYRASIHELDTLDVIASAGGAYHVPERVRFEGRTLFRRQLQEDNRLTDVSYAEVTADGAVVTYLLNRAEALARPLVAIPAEVRDGMVWEAWLDGTVPAFVNEVQGGEISDTPFGPRRLWGIHTLYADGTSAGGTVFAEGIGPVGKVDLNGLVTFFDRIVVPLDDPGDEPVDLPPPIALEPVTWADGSPVSFAASQTVSLSALHHLGTSDATIIHRRHEYSPLFCNDLLAPGRPRPMQDCYRWVDGPLEILQSRPDEELTAPGHGAETCPRSDASGILPGPQDQQHFFIPRGVVRQRDGLVTTNTTGHETAVRYLAMFQWRLDAMNIDSTFAPRMKDRMKFFLTEFGLGTTAGTTLPDIFASRFRYGGARASGAGVHEWSATRVIARGVLEGTGDVLLQLRDEMWVGLQGFSVQARHAIPTVRPFGSRLGNVSVEADASGQTALIHNRDGLLEELTVDGAGTVALRAIGRIETPEEHYVMGAVRAGDDLVVVTGGPPYTQCQEGLIPTATMWRGTVPAPGAPRALPTIDTVTATPAGLDLLVCWAPGAGEPELTGWTLAGEPVRAIRAAVDGSCVLLLRDPAEVAVLDGSEDPTVAPLGAFAAEGSIPGVGRVAIGVSGVGRDGLGSLEDRTLGISPMNRDTDFIYAAEPFAPLAEGGFVTHYALYGPGLHLEGAPHYGFPDVSPDLRPWEGVVDLAGNGLWAITSDGFTSFVTLLSRESRRFTEPVTGALLPIVGGGVASLVSHEPGQSTWRRFFPDGRTEDWITDTRTLDPRVVLEDGTLCGLALSGGLGCVDASGAERTMPFDDPYFLKWGTPRFEALPSGKIVILWELWQQVLPDETLAGRVDPTFVFDPVAMTVEQIDSRPVFQVSRGPDGRLWGAAWDPEENGFAMEITDTGFEEVALPVAESSTSPIVADFVRREVGFVLADRDVLLVWPRGDYGLQGRLQALSGKVLRVPWPE